MLTGHHHQCENTQVMINKQKPCFCGQKPPPAPVPHPRCQFYSHSLTCCHLHHSTALDIYCSLHQDSISEGFNLEYYMSIIHHRGMSQQSSVPVHFVFHVWKCSLIKMETCVNYNMSINGKHDSVESLEVSFVKKTFR